MRTRVINKVYPLPWGMFFGVLGLSFCLIWGLSRLTYSSFGLGGVSLLCSVFRLFVSLQGYGSRFFRFAIRIICYKRTRIYRVFVACWTRFTRVACGMPLDVFCMRIQGMCVVRQAKYQAREIEEGNVRRIKEESPLVYPSLGVYRIIRLFHVITY